MPHEKCLIHLTFVSRQFNDVFWRFRPKLGLFKETTLRGEWWNFLSVENFIRNKLCAFLNIPLLAAIIFADWLFTGTNSRYWFHARRWMKHCAVHSWLISFSLHHLSLPIPVSHPHSWGRPSLWPLSRGHRGCPSHAEVAHHAERCRLQGVITSLQLPQPTFFAALRPTNQIFHVSWHAPSTHK